MVTNPTQTPERIRLLDTEFDRLSLEACVDSVVETVRGGLRGWMSTVNVAILMSMRGMPDLQTFVERSRWVVADGQPIVWLSQLLGRPLPERVTGVDLMERLCARAEQNGHVVFFLGATQEIITAAAAAIQTRYPRLKLHTADGYFGDGEVAHRVAAINNAGTHLLFIGMGVPRQEQFIEQQWDNLTVNVAIGVGGSFDVVGGLRGRAPVVLQRSGLEWVYRLVQEPRRLWRRYLVTGAQFGVLASRALLRQKFDRRRAVVSRDE